VTPATSATVTSTVTSTVSRAAAAQTRQLVVARTRDELTAALAGPVDGLRAVVMTMGALHDGHAQLIRAAREYAEQVVVTIFVNPLQFGPNEDLDRYPRTLDADLELCRQQGADIVFAPTPGVVYPGGDPLVRVDPGPLGDRLEGASRPGHFAGMLTVVLKLLHLTAPQLAFFGEKDFQQLVLIRRMVRDLDLPVQIVGVPTVRESDGLARSSRNRYLDPAQRTAALALSRALRAGKVAASGGRAAVLAAVERELTADPLVVPDRIDLVDPETLEDAVAGPARLLLAARLGATRLIDNATVLLAPNSSPDATAIATLGED
jgi:pantoate--beta-alanine ligase